MDYQVVAADGKTYQPAKVRLGELRKIVELNPGKFTLSHAAAMHMYAGEQPAAFERSFPAEDISLWGLLGSMGVQGVKRVTREDILRSFNPNAGKSSLYEVIAGIMEGDAVPGTERELYAFGVVNTTYMTLKTKEALGKKLRKNELKFIQTYEATVVVPSEEAETVYSAAETREALWSRQGRMQVFNDLIAYGGGPGKATAAVINPRAFVARYIAPVARYVGQRISYEAKLAINGFYQSIKDLLVPQLATVDGAPYRRQPFDIEKPMLEARVRGLSSGGTSAGKNQHHTSGVVWYVIGTTALIVLAIGALVACSPLGGGNGSQPPQGAVQIDPTGTPSPTGTNTSQPASATHTQVPPSATASSTSTSTAALTPTNTLTPTETPIVLQGNIQIACEPMIAIQNSVPVSGLELALFWNNHGAPGNPVIWDGQPVLAPLVSGTGIEGLDEITNSFFADRLDRVMIYLPADIPPDGPCAVYWATDQGVVGSVIPYQVIVGGRTNTSVLLWAGIDGLRPPEVFQIYPLGGQSQETPQPTDGNDGTDPTRPPATPIPTDIPFVTPTPHGG